MKKGFVFFLAFCFLVGCSNPKMEDDPIEVEKKVVPKKEFAAIPIIETTPLVLPEENSRPRRSTITHVMLHFISNATSNPTNPYNVDEITAILAEYGVSTHYMIDREGTIYSLVPENRVAFHAGKGILSDFPMWKDRLNDYSIGIELMAIGTEEEMEQVFRLHNVDYDSIDSSFIGYTDAQYESLNRLLQNILQRNPTIKNDRTRIVGHDEYAKGRKSDPGSLFDWSKIGY